MSKPTVKSGKFHYGADCEIGDGVVVDVTEEAVFGDRCVIPPNAYLGGRSIKVGDDFYGYDWTHPQEHGVLAVSKEWIRTPVMRGWLEVGRGRRDCEDAVLTVGSRCTFHENRVDLAERVTIGDDVGLSPEVCIYTHGYWLSPLDGYPCRYGAVVVGSGTIVGFRSTLLPGAYVPENCVIGAGSVVCGHLDQERAVYAGSPARMINGIFSPPPDVKAEVVRGIMAAYARSLDYRNLPTFYVWTGCVIFVGGMKAPSAVIDLQARTLEGEENELTDDLRWYLFSRGVRVYTKRRFKKLGRK